MAFSMARKKDLPTVLGKINLRFGTPFVSIWILGLVMSVLVLFVDLTGIVVVSTFALLFWYVLVNVAALRLNCERRLCPRWLPVLGLSTCLILLTAVFFVAPLAWTTGVIFLFVGGVFYIVRKKLTRKES